MSNLIEQMEQLTATLSDHEVKRVIMSSNKAEIFFKDHKKVTIQTHNNHMMHIKVRLTVGKNTTAHNWVSDVKGYNALNELLEDVQRARTQLVVNDYNEIGYMFEGME